MDHPNLPNIVDFFEHESFFYIVMIFIEGENMQKLVDKHNLSVDELLSLADILCRTLTYVHSQGVIHRDVEPSNIILCQDGSPVLVDFGFAGFRQSGNLIIHPPPSLPVTPGFSPPEQYGLGFIDTHSDQYSLAATIYALLTGHTPIESTMRINDQEAIHPIRLISKDVPEYVEQALIQALSIQPKDHYPDIESFRVSLQGVMCA
jgi:serine/threonine protein kinase